MSGEISLSPGSSASIEQTQKNLLDAIHHAGHLLPAQGPITVFIHHNTLHAFEDHPFLEGVKKGSQTFGCQPFLSEDRYRDALNKGRIRSSELAEALRNALGESAGQHVIGTTTRFELHLAMLQFPLRFGPTPELLWFVADTDALRQISQDASPAVRSRLIAETRRWVMRDLRGGNESRRNADGQKRKRTSILDPVFDRFDTRAIEAWSEKVWEAFTMQALWRVCCDGVSGLPNFASMATPPLRHRDMLLRATGADSDLAVGEVLIRFCAAFLDQGFASWQLPDRDKGFFRAFCSVYRGGLGSPEPWMRGLSAEIRRVEASLVSALESIRESLEILGVAEPEWEDFIGSTLLTLRGWGGMIQEVEVRGDSVARPIPGGSVVEFLAVRLLLDRLALAYYARETIGFAGPLAELRGELRNSVNLQTRPSDEQRAFLVFQIAQLVGWTPDELYRLKKADWSSLLKEVEEFSAVERRQIFHLAYERRFRTQTLDALALHAPKSSDPASRPRAQITTCLDEREESFRRHMEEVAPDVQTFGAAGFFAVAMYYRGATDAHFVPLCPIVIRPKHWVCEEVDRAREEMHRQRAITRKLLGTASHRFHVGSRNFLLGAIVSVALGALATFPLVARVLFPRLTSRIRKIMGRVIQAPPETRLKLERTELEPSPENGHIGFTLEEMTSIAERLLRDIGLLSGFARLVVTLGHGSISLNNPHKSAYDCGACGGSSGAPNGRALSQILNDSRVREQLAKRGLTIPDDTYFVGGFHNTCNDSVILFDVDCVPESHRAELAVLEKEFEATCDRNAHERSRRFMSAPTTQSFAAARQHVEARSEDLAQTRPELGHATNAICLVGRRRWSKGLYLDRRAFLASYDPTQDDENATILARTLAAVFPVCGGINLEYYFSHIDSMGYGCGTKLPHNVTSLLGVMDGAASDLRTGLPWQMVEIHEPVRLLIVVETTPKALLGIMDTNEVIGKLARNGWVQLATQDPQTGTLKVYENGAFHDYRPETDSLPKASSSLDWYRGWRDHLEFAEIEA